MSAIECSKPPKMKVITQRITGRNDLVFLCISTAMYISAPQKKPSIKILYHSFAKRLYIAALVSKQALYSNPIKNALIKLAAKITKASMADCFELT